MNINHDINSLKQPEIIQKIYAVQKNIFSGYMRYNNQIVSAFNFKQATKNQNLCHKKVMVEC